MTRIVLIVTILLSFSTIKGQGLEIAVYTEPQITWLSSDEGAVISSGSALNLNTGIEFDIFFMPNYAFAIGVNLNNQGGRILYTEDIVFNRASSDLTVPGGSILKHNLQYIGIPMGLKLKSEELGYTSFYVNGGLLPLFNLKANTSSDQLSYVRENIQPEVHLFSMNYYIELGIEYRLAGNTAIIAGLKWSAGFNDVTVNDFANNNLNSAGLHIGLLF